MRDPTAAQRLPEGEHASSGLSPHPRTCPKEIYVRNSRLAAAFVVLASSLLAVAPVLAQNDGWVANGKTLFLKGPAYKQVGIGTASPQASLDVTGGDLTVGRAGKQFIFHSQWWLSNPEFLAIAPQIPNGWDFDRSISFWRNGNFQVGNGITQIVM